MTERFPYAVDPKYRPLLVLFGFVAWRAMRGPTPSELCDRVDELTHTVSSEQLRAQCISTYDAIQDLSDRMYGELATCLEQATTMEQAAACGGR